MTELLVTLGLVGVGYLASLLSKYAMRRKERALKQARPRGEVYLIPPFALGPSLFVLVALLFVAAIPPLVYLSGSLITWEDVFVVYGFSLLPALFIVWNLAINSGIIILTDDAVILRRFGRERRMAYGEIEQIKERNANPLFPSLVLKGRGRRLKINCRAEKFAYIHHQLLERTEALSMEREEPGTSKPATSGVLTVQIRRGPFLFNTLGSMVIAGAILLAGLFLMDFRANPDPLLALAVYLLISIGVLVLVGAAMVSSELKPRQPVALEFHPHEIRFKRLLGPWQRFPVEELVALQRQEQVLPVHVRTDGAWIEERTVRYPLLLRFTGGREIYLDERRCRQMGCSPQKLYRRLERLYVSPS
ncbi:MAG: hypothetical protein ACLFU8_10995 [Anaerolineales bacterium]